MRGIFDIFPTSMSVVVFVIGTFVLMAFFLGYIGDFHAKITKPGIDKMRAVDIAHKIGNCLENVSAEKIVERLEICKAQTEAKFVELTDIESGNEWSRGTKGEGTEHEIALNLEDHVGGLYVEV